MSPKDISYFTMRWSKSLLLILIIATLLATINRFELLHHALDYAHGSQATPAFVPVRKFDVIPYPLNLKNASGLVKMLRAGQPVTIPPINLKYTSVNFSPGSLKSCDSSSKYGILIMIKSRVGNQEDRIQLRRTWANRNYLSKFHVKIKYMFVLGKSLHNELNESVLKENETYGDILIGDFIDAYRNLTYKTMLGIRWAVELCPNFQFYISFDDDSYLSVSNLVEFIRNPYNYPKTSEGKDGSFGTVLKPTEHFFSGHTLRYSLASPIRNKKSKYYLSLDEYPFRFFPAYVVGYFVAMSWETVTSFYHLSPFVKHLAMEDIYLGLLANKLRIPPFDITDLVSDGIILRTMSVKRKENLEMLRDFIAIHHIQPTGKRTYIWKQLHWTQLTSL